MPQWVTFVGITIVVLGTVLVLSTLTQRAISHDANRSTGPGPDRTTDAFDTAVSSSDTPSQSHPPLRRIDQDDAGDETVEPESEEPAVVEEGSSAQTVTQQRDSDTRRNEGDIDRSTAADSDPTHHVSDREEFRPAREPDISSFTTGQLLANVTLSQGLFAAVLIGAAWYASIPASAFGIQWSSAVVVTGVVVGTLLGVSLYVASELGAATAKRFSFDHDELLRELLAPESGSEWIVLVLVVLPVIAIFEELLFRAALIGVVSAGFGISPWILAVVSSVVFAIGHGIQGTVGIVVTGVLGFVLAAAFIVTGNLFVVIVAHYCINLFEFVVHEGLDVEWAETLAS